MTVRFKIDYYYTFEFIFLVVVFLRFDIEVNFLLIKNIETFDDGKL